MGSALHGPSAAGSPLTSQAKCPLLGSITALRPGLATANEMEPQTRWVFAVRHSSASASKSSLLASCTDWHDAPSPTSPSSGTPLRNHSPVPRSSDGSEMKSSLTPSLLVVCCKLLPGKDRPLECSLRPARLARSVQRVYVLIVPGAVCSALIHRSAPTCTDCPGRLLTPPFRPLVR